MVVERLVRLLRVANFEVALVLVRHDVQLESVPSVLDVGQLLEHKSSKSHMSSHSHSLSHSISLSIFTSSP